MLRITGSRKSRISNRLAVFAALLLAITSLSGVSNTDLFTPGADGQHAGTTVSETRNDRVSSGTKATVKKNKGFKVSLFLLRNR
jgi:hypothetical protein